MIGLVIGLLVAKLGIPSFVVTLAFFLGLQGVHAEADRSGRLRPVRDEVLRGITIKNDAGRRRLDRGRSRSSAIYAGLLFWRQPRLVAKDLHRPPTCAGGCQDRRRSRSILLGMTAFLSQNRSRNPTFPIEGIPYAVLRRRSRC